MPKHVEVQFRIEIPDDPRITEGNLEEWLRFRLNDNGDMAADNPLDDILGEPEPIFGTFNWRWV